MKPDGSFHFVEHGHAPDANVGKWQHRLEPLNKRLAGGCHLTRRISDSIENAGFTLDQLDTYYFKGEPKLFGHTFEGRAAKRWNGEGLSGLLRRALPFAERTEQRPAQ